MSLSKEKICNNCNITYKSTHKYFCKSCYEDGRQYLVVKTDDKVNKIKNIRYIKDSGYVLIHRPDHPNSHKNGYILEHTFIVSEHIGRPLKKGENIHHINGIRDDNRIENLELWSRSQPSGQRVEDKIAWCQEFLKSYGYTVIRPLPKGEFKQQFIPKVIKCKKSRASGETIVQPLAAQLQSH